MSSAGRSEKQMSSVKNLGWAVGSVKWSLFLIGVDPFRIYKLTKRQSMSELGEPQVSVESLDWLRSIWRRLMVIISVFNSLYSCALGVAGLVIANAGGKPKDALGGKQSAHGRWLGLALQVSETLGDPMANSPRLASLVYFGALAASVFSMSVQPARYALGSPFDSPILRFLLRRKLEIQRTEWLIVRRLRSLEESIRNRYHPSLGTEGDTSEQSNPLLSLIHHEEPPGRLEQQRRLVRASYRDWRRLRELHPPALSVEAHRQLATFCGPFIIGLLVIASIACSLISIGLVIVVGTNRMHGQRLSVPSAGHLVERLTLLSRPEKFTLAEMIFMIMLGGWGVCLTFGILLIQEKGQLDMIDAMRVELASLLTYLRTQQYESNSTAQTDAKLLKLLIRLDIFGQEAESSVRTISQLNTTIISVSIVCAVSVLVSRKLVPADAHLDIQVPITCVIWLYTNVLMLISSAMPSRVMRIKQIVWSILAEQARLRHLHCDLFSRPDWKTEDPLAILWRKQVLNQTFITNHHSVRALGIGVTFRRVLQVNFLALSIVSWLQSRNSAD